MLPESTPCDSASPEDWSSWRRMALLDRLLYVHSFLEAFPFLFAWHLSSSSCKRDVCRKHLFQTRCLLVTVDSDFGAWRLLSIASPGIACYFDCDHSAAFLLLISSQASVQYEMFRGSHRQAKVWTSVSASVVPVPVLQGRIYGPLETVRVCKEAQLRSSSSLPGWHT